MDLSTEQSGDVAKLCAMAPRSEPNSQQDAWTENELRIRVMVRERLSKKIGQTAQSDDYEDIVVRKIQKRFVPTDRSDPLWRISQSDPLWIPSVVTEEVDRFVHGKQLDLWSAHKTVVAEAFEEAFTPAARGLDKNYSDFLFHSVFKHFSARFSDCMAAGDTGQWLREFTKQAVDTEIMDFLPGRFVSEETKLFVQKRREERRQAQSDVVLPIVKRSLPSAAREFEGYYVPLLLEHVLTRIAKDRDTRSSSQEWLKATAERVIEPSITKLTNDDRELRDEELATLFRAGYEKCRTMLLERYATKLHELSLSIVYATSLCPESEDPVEFARDVAQQVSLKLLEKLDSYKLESSFKTWLGKVVENEARTRTRKVRGRSTQVVRKYVSFEELQQEPVAPAIHDREHREILRKALQKHRAQNAKSADAIELRYFEELDTPEVADRIGTTKGYVGQLFSDDYPKIRKILIDDYGLTGTDL
jgi:RNA polymerase sigma factor (sigma-70 family)